MCAGQASEMPLSLTLRQLNAIADVILTVLVHNL